MASSDIVERTAMLLDDFESWCSDVGKSERKQEICASLRGVSTHSEDCCSHAGLMLVMLQKLTSITAHPQSEILSVS